MYCFTKFYFKHLSHKLSFILNTFLTILTNKQYWPTDRQTNRLTNWLADQLTGRHTCPHIGRHTDTPTQKHTLSGQPTNSNDECHARPRLTARTVRRFDVCYPVAACVRPRTSVTCWCMLYGADEWLILSQARGSLRRKCWSAVIHATYPPMSVGRHAIATLAQFLKMSGNEGSWCMLRG